MQPGVSASQDEEEEQISKLDHFGRLDRVVELDCAMAGRVLVCADRAGEQIGDRLLFPALHARVSKNAILRTEYLPHQGHSEEFVRQTRDATYLDFDGLHRSERGRFVVAECEARPGRRQCRMKTARQTVVRPDLGQCVGIFQQSPPLARDSTPVAALGFLDERPIRACDSSQAHASDRRASMAFRLGGGWSYLPRSLNPWIRLLKPGSVLNDWSRFRLRPGSGRLRTSP